MEIMCGKVTKMEGNVSELKARRTGTKRTTSGRGGGAKGRQQC